ncbi:hypothetical protein [Anaeromyxobacter diazotrophicus]|uniref:Outer membrane protein beta-barrel domain-containing protein n=1 Tax=Anaeromyxobacter diazotrophicus TaxID=2590199 RepID=A0A7I9VH81_9BACT|nr:hypothetical protein [Anaeromyxobacter diazotrophicus]GEJ55751.1 hypothetical protein AMYX_04920 [Anaeromyxobacter diazotrophicus]
MRKNWVAIAVAVAGLCWSSSARAGDGSSFAGPGSVSLAAERLFGIHHARPSVGSNYTSFSLFGPGGLEAGVAPYSIPRIGLDYFAAGGLTVGLGAEVGVVSPENGSNTTILGLNPRLGWALRASDAVTFWPRAGLSYVMVDLGSSAYLLAAALEAQLVVTPTRNFGFLLGPTADIGLSATHTKVTELGFQAGLIGWF